MQANAKLARENAGNRGLAGAARTGEKVSVGNSAEL